jgi:DNA modification methylase
MVFYPTFDDTESNLELREYFYSEKEKGNLSNKQINELLGYSTKGSGMAGHYFKKDKTQFIFPKKSDYLKLQQTGFFQKSYDELLILYESNKRTFNQQFTEGKKYITKQGGISDVYGNKHKDIITVNEGKRFPKSILKFNRDKEKLHPTQKPIALLEYLIKTYTNENETVLDNCMGSGSTGVACINTNRNFIGIEKDDKYFEIAKDRIEKAKESLFDM